MAQLSVFMYVYNFVLFKKFFPTQGHEDSMLFGKFYFASYLDIQSTCSWFWFVFVL